jgi:antitoxin component YwqK of YwqJK toxin-antitoxin module
MYYKDGKREGENKSWDKEGNLTEHKIYTGDEVIEDFLKN